MLRRLVERTVAGWMYVPINDASAKTVARIVATNSEQGDLGLPAVSEDQAKTFRVYDGPSRDAIRPMAVHTAYRSTSSPTYGSWTRTSTPASRPGRTCVASPPRCSHRESQGGGS
jgi:hypothetical protein